MGMGAEFAPRNYVWRGKKICLSRRGKEKQDTVNLPHNKANSYRSLEQLHKVVRLRRRGESQVRNQGGQTKELKSSMQHSLGDAKDIKKLFQGQ